MRELTVKQQRYLTGLLDHRIPSNIEAYRRAYDCSGMAPATIAEESRRMRKHPLITLAYDKAMDRREREMTRDATSQRRFIVDRLTHEAETAESDSARVRALELLGKVTTVGLFADTLITESRSTDSEMELLDELRERLGNLLPPADAATPECVAAEPGVETDEPESEPEPEPDGGSTIH